MQIKTLHAPAPYSRGLHAWGSVSLSEGDILLLFVEPLQADEWVVLVLSEDGSLHAQDDYTYCLARPMYEYPAVIRNLSGAYHAQVQIETERTIGVALYQALKRTD